MKFAAMIDTVARRSFVLAIITFTTAFSIMQSMAEPAPVASAITVEIKEFQFVPAVVTIAPGQTIVWINRDDEPHSVVANDKSFRSAALDSNEHFTKSFTANGEFSYYCSFHRHMQGKVIVRPSQ